MSSVAIHVENVSLQYPIYGSDHRSLKQNLINISSAGRCLRANKVIVVQALQNITFSLTRGDRLGLIGRNGAGKTTLLKVLASIYKPTAGTLNLRGQVSSLLDVGLGMNEHLTGYENILSRGLIMGQTKKEIKMLIPGIAEFTEIGDFLAMPVKTYSAGMRLRLAFAIATAVAPQILLMDEMISTGDIQFINKARERLAQFMNHSEILVFASHAHDHIRTFCNKLLWLESGKLVALGPVDEVIEQYERAAQIATAAIHQPADFSLEIA